MLLRADCTLLQAMLRRKKLIWDTSRATSLAMSMMVSKRRSPPMFRTLWIRTKSMRTIRMPSSLTERRSRTVSPQRDASVRGR